MSTSAEGPILRVHDVDVVYGEAIHVLRRVNLEVLSGSIVAVLGANGAGKTSLLRACSGLLGVHRGSVISGTIELEGVRIERAHPASIVRRGLAQVMEGRRIFGELTVEENLRAGAFTRRDRASVRATFEHVLELFPVLAERRRNQAGYLSGGEQQMLAIARSLMAAPRLLLLDEPSLGLAPMIVNQIREIIATINLSGTSVLLVEQNASMALSIAHHAYVLETGRVVREAPAAELLHDPDIARLYLGGEASGARSFAASTPSSRVRSWMP
ncbi:MAG TPA: ABC transporter ATP-binding protein [Acidimicrobiia bacterium]|jgi:branched-chain amino acid transport system ATP-binding protein